MVAKERPSHVPHAEYFRSGRWWLEASFDKGATSTSILLDSKVYAQTQGGYTTRPVIKAEDCRCNMELYRPPEIKY